MKPMHYTTLRNTLFVLLVFGATVFGATRSASAVDLFLKVDEIEGESTIKGHEKEIVAESWSFEISNTVIRELGGGAGAGKVKFNDIQITKKIDKASPLLMLACSTGKHIPKVVLKIIKRDGDRPKDYLIITMTDVLISSIQVNGETSDDSMHEKLTINFSGIKVEYPQQKPDGTAGEPIKYGWDLKQNKPI